MTKQHICLAAVLLATSSNNQHVTTDAFTPNTPCQHHHSSLLYAEAENSNNQKDSDRARIERNFEQAMDNDWRAFRALLVAQEKAEAEEKAAKIKQHQEEFCDEKPSNTSDDVNSFLSLSAGAPAEDEKLKKQAHLSDMFGSAISSLFKKKNNTKNNISTDGDNGCDIFTGDSVGGNDILKHHAEKSQDPFVTKDELPILLESKVSLNKHRWAHPISHIEPGCTLIANEKLGGVFHQTVVLIIDHNDALGSTGIVINRPLDGNLLKIASETESNVDLSLKLAFNTAPVTYGGPVMTDEYSILHGFGEVIGSKKLAPGVFVGGSEELMSEVRTNSEFSPSETLFVKGHAEWVPGQLTKEVKKGVWYVASVSSDFILRYAGAPTCDDDNKDDLWSDILSCMGGRYEEIASVYAGRGDMRGMKP